jgi:hypothetical protein
MRKGLGGHMKETGRAHGSQFGLFGGSSFPFPFPFPFLRLMYIDHFFYIIRVIAISYRRIPIYIEKPRSEIWH